MTLVKFGVQWNNWKKQNGITEHSICDRWSKSVWPWKVKQKIDIETLFVIRDQKKRKSSERERDNRLYCTSLVFIIMSTSILSIKLHNEYVTKRKDFSLSGCTMSLAAAPVAWTREEVDRCPSTRVPSPRICKPLFLSYKDTLKFQYLFHFSMF